MQERAEITKAGILDTAIKLFSQNGFHGAKVDGIAAAAEVNKQRIYAYYNSKESLFEAALKHVFEEVSLFSTATLEKALQEPENLTSMLLADFMGLHAKHPYFWRLLAWANLSKGVSAESLLEIRAVQNEVIAKAFKIAREKDFVKDISFTTYIFNLMAVSFFYYANRKTLSGTFSSEIYTPAGRRKLMEQLVSLF